jgi:hypothetical protein
MTKPVTARAISLTIGVILILGSIFLLWQIAHYVWHQFLLLPASLAVGLLTAASTVLVATATVVLGRTYDRQREIESHFRARKLEIYDEFLKELFRVFHAAAKEQPDLVEFLRDWQRKIVVWGGPAVLLRYIEWMRHLRTKPASAESFFKMGDMILEMRKDLGQSNKGLSRQTFVHTLLKHPDLLLAAASQNPDVSLTDLVELEKKLDAIETKK